MEGRGRSCGRRKGFFGGDGTRGREVAIAECGGDGDGTCYAGAGHEAEDMRVAGRVGGGEVRAFEAEGEGDAGCCVGGRWVGGGLFGLGLIDQAGKPFGPLGTFDTLGFASGESLEELQVFGRRSFRGGGRSALFSEQELDHEIIVGGRALGIFGRQMSNSGERVEFADGGFGMVDVEMGDWGPARTASQSGAGKRNGDAGLGLDFLTDIGVGSNVPIPAISNGGDFAVENSSQLV